MPLAKDPWFERVSKAAPQQGELRLAGNMAVLVRSAAFSAVTGVQQNITELKQYVAFVSDVQRSSGEIREERVLVRAEVPEQSRDSAALGELLPLVPANTGFYRAWMGEPAEDATRLLTEKVLVPRSELRTHLAPEANKGAQAQTASASRNRITRDPTIPAEWWPMKRRM